MEVLIDHDANPDIPDLEAYTALHNAVGAPDILKMLLTKSKNINAQNMDGESPLYLASDRGLAESALILLEYGADPNLPNKEGECLPACTLFSDNGTQTAKHNDWVHAEVVPQPAPPLP